MKKIILFFLMSASMLIPPLVKGQNNQLVILQNGTTTVVTDPVSRTSATYSERKLIKDAILNFDQTAFHPNQIEGGLTISNGMVLWRYVYSSKFGTAVYLERNLFGNEFNVVLLDAKKQAIILFNQENCPIQGYALQPIAWSGDGKDVIFEAVVFDTEKEHEGIFLVHLESRKATQLGIPENYTNTPVFNPELHLLAFTSTSSPVRDLVHGISDKVQTFDMAGGELTTILLEKGKSHKVLGWINGGNHYQKTIPFHQEDPGGMALTPVQLGFKLPWSSGTGYCVSRVGTPAPTGTTSPGVSCGTVYNVGFDNHEYVAVDFDSPNNVYDAVRAVAAGTVTTVISGTTGYGKYVIVTHSDNSQTLYGHLNSISVSANQVVGQGCVLGDGGTTGNSSGDHIHFEWRVGGTKYYATFSDCSCLPKKGYRYYSTNADGPCIGNDNPCDGTAITALASCSYTSGTNVGATSTTNPAWSMNCPYSNAKDVWYKVNIPASGYATIRTASGTMTDAEMAIYYNSCGSLTYLGCEDDNSNGNGSLMPVMAVSGPVGTTLFIRIWGYSGSTGSFSLCALNYVSANKTADEFVLKIPEGINSNIEQNRMDVYPNPVTENEFFVRFENSQTQQKALLELINFDGKVLTSQSVDAINGVNTFRVEDNFPSGMYFVVIRLESGQIFSKKLVITN